MSIELAQATIRENARYLALIEDVPPKDLDAWVRCWARLASINKDEATLTLENLPAHLLKEQPADPKQRAAVEKLNDFYTAVASWLRHWKSGIEIPALYQTYWAEYKVFALLAEARHKLIRGLFDEAQRKRIRDLSDRKPNIFDIFHSPDFAWLLAEAAVCRQILNNQLPKGRLYQHTKSYLDTLTFFGEDPALKPVADLITFVTRLDLVFEWQARELAKRDKEFRDGYFNPYIGIFRCWNAKCRRDLDLEIFTIEESPSPRRGSRIGQKKPRRKRECEEL